MTFATLVNCRCIAKEVGSRLLVVNIDILAKYLGGFDFSSGAESDKIRNFFKKAFQSGLPDQTSAPTAEGQLLHPSILPGLPFYLGKRINIII